MKGRSKGCIWKWCSFFAILTIVCGSVRIFAEENQGADIVFVVDDSASMKENDPNKLAGEAVRRFIDLLPVEGDKTGIVTYSYDPLERQDLITISGAESKNVLKKFSLEKIKQDGRNTDTAAGLSAGGNILDLDSSSAKKAIILITDGENDLRNRERSNAQSDATLEEFFKKGYPVYTIGVNPQTATFKEYLTNIANRSKGRVWFPKSSEELNAIIKEVASELGNVALANSDIVSVNNTDFTNIKQTIPKEVIEANIQIDHEEGIDLEVLDNGGKAVNLNSKNIVVYSEEKYTNIKLLNPKEGDWTIRVKSSTKQIQVKVDWIFNYDVAVNLAVPKGVKAGDTKTVEVTLSNKGKNFSKDQYKGISGQLEVRNSKTNQSTTYDLKLDGERLIAEVDFKDKADYVLKSTIKGDGLEKSSQDVLVDLSEQDSKTGKEEKGFPLWLLLLGGLVGVGVVLALLFKRSQGGTFILQGSVKIDYTEASEVLDSFTIRLPSKTRIKLSELIKDRTKKLKDIDEKKIILTAVSSNRIKLENKGEGILIRGLKQNILHQGATAILSKDNSKQIHITYL